MEMEQSATDNIVYPALALGGDGSLTCVEGMIALLRPNAHALRSGYYDQLVLIDALGMAHHVTGATPEEQNRFLIWLSRAFNVTVPIRLLIGRREEVSLADAKARIVQEVRRNGEFWEAGGDLADLEERIKTAPSFAAISAIFR